MTILDRILETKREEVVAAKLRRPLDALRRDADRLPPARDFHAAVIGDGSGIRLIAEVKKASPSAGLIVRDFDPVAIARKYHECGAAALSVLTDETYFQGRLEYIEQVRRDVPLPVLRKDFIVDEYQVFQSRAAGADAILLIAEVLDTKRIAAFRSIARELGLGVLVEVHSAEDLAGVLAELGPPSRDRYLLGINNRDLKAQRTDLATSVRLAATLPKGVPFVSESGIGQRSDVIALQEIGACAILVGESLLKANDIGAKIAELMGTTPVTRPVRS